MAIIQIVNKSDTQVSTSIGTILPGATNIQNIQYDQLPIPLRLYQELERLKVDNRIDYVVLEDPNVRDDIELAPYKNSLAPDFNKIGEPTVGDYTSGFFDFWTTSTLISDAVQGVSDTILQIAPAKAGSLIGTTPIISNTTLFSAKIPNGLSTAWNPAAPGSTITNLVVDGSYTLTTPNSSTIFRAGKASDPSTAGIFTYVINNVDGPTYDIGVNGPGIIGPITIDSLVTYNTLWLKGNAHIDTMQASEGRRLHALKHSEAGLSNNVEVFFDDVNTAPSFSVPLAATDNTPVNKYLSGIEAYGLGSTFDISYTAAVGIFRKAYHPIAVGQVSCPGHTTSNDNPGTIPNVNDNFPISRVLTLGAPNQSSLLPSMNAILRKPNGDGVSSATALTIPVNTYGVVSTNKTDLFFDENKRIILDTGTYSGNATSFDSTIPLVNGNAQQRHNGCLQYPNVVDYPAMSGSQEYQRFISKPSASTGQLTLNGINYTNINPYNTGDLNVLIHLTTSGKWYDLGTPIGSFNGTGSGNSKANSIGALNQSASSGSIVAWSVGVDSTAFNLNEYRLVIIFRNTNHSIVSLSEV